MIETQAIRSTLANSTRSIGPHMTSGLEPGRMPELLRDHFEFVWRSLRRLGLDEGLADDGAQEVFVVASRKLDQIEPGRERSFLRKRVARRREVSEDDSVELVDPAPSPEALLDQRRARAVLDDLLDEIPPDARAIFVLYELEGLELQEIAELLSLQRGTVASRLRRGRGLFAAAAKRRQARSMMNGGGR
jgi:RNA polymerase sigma-70 factor, ECF subfamily